MKGNGIVSKVVNRVRQLTRSKAERALIKYELEDDCGNPTKAGRQYVLRDMAENLWKEKRKEIGESLVKSEKEDKEDKKEEDAETDA